MRIELHRPTVPSRLVVLAIGGGLALASFEAAFAQLAATLSGAPQQVIPYASEPGVPALTIPLGTPSQFPTDNGSGGTGAGNNGSGSGGGGPAGDSTALGTMMSQSWGALAAANAQALGVNASALAATCVVESGCQNVGGSGTVAGAFQMTASTYNSMIQAALAQNPSLASQIVQGSAGQMDPCVGVHRGVGISPSGGTVLAGAGDFQSKRCRRAWLLQLRPGGRCGHRECAADRDDCIGAKYVFADCPGE